jgi:hypothetical protein
MMKQLFFIAALLVPGLAHGQNPASLSVTVVPGPGSIACDIGPSYTGSIPAAAAKAGFTHCAANYDFTQTQSFTDSIGAHQWSNMSSWFSCTDTPGSWLLTNHWSDTACDTNHLNVTTDGGTEVLALSYYLTDAQAGKYSNNPLLGLRLV